VTRAATYQYDLGDVAMLKFNPEAALPHYETAFRYRPDNPRYAFGYARAAYDERKYSEAEKGWNTALQLLRDLPARDPGTYRLNIARTLTNLGLLYSSTGHLAEAEKAFSEALAIYRDLAASNPVVFSEKIKSLTALLADLKAIPKGK